MDSRGICLVIEDEPDIAGLIELVLTGMGFEVIKAETGADGLLAANGAELTLITLDIGLPDMDGHEVAHRVRPLSNAPILMITAYAQTLDELNGMAAGARAYLIKPFRPSVLREMVTDLCPQPTKSQLAPSQTPD